MGIKTIEIKNIKISEEYFPSINLKRKIYQSPRIKIVTDVERGLSDGLGFPTDDLPDYLSIV
jgi:hypothetical protein